MGMTAAIIHLAAGDPEQALAALTPALEASGRTRLPRWSAVEALLVGAAAHDDLGDRRAAEESLERALELAEPDGLVLPFLLAPVQALLEHLPRHRTAHATLVRTILDLRAGSSSPHAEPFPMLDELSHAELRVLRFLPSNLKTPEIASELCISANTVRTHIRHIYAKLDAHDRSEAVARARELGLLAASWRR
jgi:LuxR family transcriptional regulator, maltose regulon positive regulatory protein